MVVTGVSESLIWTLPFFSGLNENDQIDLLRVSKFKRCRRHQLIFAHGDKLSHCYAIYKGAVQLFRTTPDGHEMTSDILIAGELVLDPMFLENAPRHVTNAKVIEDATLLAIPVGWLKERLTLFGDLAVKLIATLSRRLRFSQVETEHQTTMYAAQAIACFLQHLCVMHNFDPAGFELPYTKSLIASRLGMELETFSRALPKLEKLGISVNGKHVTFNDIDFTRQHTCNLCTMSGNCESGKTLQEKAARLA